MTNKKTNKFKSLLGGLGLAALTALSPNVKAQDVDFTQSGSVGSSETQEAIMEHGTVYAFKEIKESRDNPLGIEKYPVSKMNGNKPSVVFSPYEIEGNRIILNNSGQFAKKPEDATPQYDTKNLDFQGDKLEIKTKDFSNLFKTLVIKGSDGINDTVYYFHQPSGNGEKQNVVWAYKDDVQEIGVTDNRENYYVQTDEIWGWKVDKEKSRGNLEGILNSDYPKKYDLIEPTTGEVQGIVEVEEDNFYSPYDDKSKKRSGNRNFDLSWFQPKLDVDGVVAGDNLYGQASFTLGFGSENLSIGPFISYNIGNQNNTWNLGKPTNESLQQEKEPLYKEGDTTRYAITNKDVTKTPMYQNYEWGAGISFNGMISNSFGLEGKVGLTYRNVKQQYEGEISTDIISEDANGNVVDSTRLEIGNGEGDNYIKNLGKEVTFTGSAGIEYFPGKDNSSFSVEGNVKYETGLGEKSKSGDFKYGLGINWYLNR